MSILNVILIMLAAGVLGGWVNYLLPSNETEEKKKIRTILTCIVLGTGATLLVPLFLEIAQSKLLDQMHFGWSNSEMNNEEKPDDPAAVHLVIDSSKGKSDTIYVAALRSGVKESVKAADNNHDAPKSYLLFAAYCLVASAAGFKFIDSVINSVLREKENTQLKTKNEDLKKETNKRQANSQISQKKEHEEIRKHLLHEKTEEIKLKVSNPDLDISFPVIPELPPIIHPDDPQKGRFGGKSERNFRKLDADVKPSSNPNYFHVKLWVESTDPENHPHNSETIFYIHDSFSPSVLTCKSNETKEMLAYGAFTVGVITDEGRTMLELDLAKDQRFPKDFRDR
jgi:hypothetical protein